MIRKNKIVREMFVSYQKLRMVGLTPIGWRVSQEVMLLVHNDIADIEMQFGDAIRATGADLLFFDVPVTVSDDPVSAWSIDTQTGVSIVGDWRCSEGEPYKTTPASRLFGSQPTSLH